MALLISNGGGSRYDKSHILGSLTIQLNPGVKVSPSLEFHYFHCLPVKVIKGALRHEGGRPRRPSTHASTPLSLNSMTGSVVCRPRMRLPESGRISGIRMPTMPLSPVWAVDPHRDADEHEGPEQFRSHDIRPFSAGMTPHTWPLVPSMLTGWVDDLRASTEGLGETEPLPERLRDGIPASSRSIRFSTATVERAGWC